MTGYIGGISAVKGCCKLSGGINYSLNLPISERDVGFYQIFTYMPSVEKVP